MTKKLQFVQGSIALAALSSTAAAQSIPDFVLAETTQDQLVLFQDLDDNGVIDADPEVVALYNDGMGGTNFSSPRDVALRMEGGKATCYWIDTTHDQVFRGQDIDGNGVIDLGEETFYYTMGPASPDGIALTGDGAVWSSSDGSTAVGLFRSRDTNGNGTANDAGESLNIVPGGVPHPVEQDSGMATVGTDDFQRMTQHGNGVVVFNDNENSAHFRFEDINSDGDALDVGEARLFFNGTGEDPALDMNPDFAASAPGSDPRNMVVTPGSGYAWISRMATTVEGGNEIVYLGTDPSQTSSFGVNQFGEFINGIIFRCEDLNLDNDCNDAGEVKTFYDGSGQVPSALEVFEKIIGIHGEGSVIWVCELDNNSTPVFHKLEDLNGDGDAMDAGEQTLRVWDASSIFPASVFFTGAGAFIYEMGVIDHLAFANPGPGGGSIVYCTAKTNSQGCTPDIASTGTPSLTDPNPFTVSSTMILNNKPGIGFYGFGRFSLPFQGGFLCVQPPIKRTAVQTSGGNPPPNDCSGTLSFDYNALIQSGSDPALTLGTTVNTQFWSRDPQSPSTTNLTNALEFVIQN